MEPVSDDDQPALQPTPPPADSAPINSPLARIPVDIGSHRALLFALDQPVQFDQSAWEQYWPFIDNVWCLHNKADVTAHLQTTGKTEKFWGGCRLQRKWSQQERKEDSGRKRTRREPGQCPAKFRVVMNPDGGRMLERSKEGHSHDLDHIDAIKRCTGVRRLVSDPFFSSWESGPILAYLKDPANAPPTQPDLLGLAGGRYLERREIVNIFSQKLRAAYPSLDASSLKKQKEKYEGVKTCNFKGCNLNFKDAKELARHKKEAHEERRHDHSDKLYTCPRKECHRHKRSKGFATVLAVKEHMSRMSHWGLVGYHGGDDGMRLIDVLTEEERLAADSGQHLDFDEVASEQQSPTGQGLLQSQSSPAQGLLQQRPLPDTDLAMFSALQNGNLEGMHPLGHSMLPLDPTMQLSDHDPQQRQEMLQRLEAMETERQRIEQEMARLRNALFAG